MPAETFWRDASNRLTCCLDDLDSLEYPAVCAALRDAMGLKPDGELIIGPDGMFWKYRRGEQQIRIDWDIWFAFMVVAVNVEAEPLVQEIDAWLKTSRWAKPANLGR